LIKCLIIIPRYICKILHKNIRFLFKKIEIKNIQLTLSTTLSKAKMANLDKQSDYKIAAQEIENLLNLHEKNKSIPSDYVTNGVKLIEEANKIQSYDELADKILEFDSSYTKFQIIEMLKVSFDNQPFSEQEYKNYLIRYANNLKLESAWKCSKKFFTNGKPFIWFYPYLRRETAINFINSGAKVFLVRHSGTFNNKFVVTYRNLYSNDFSHWLITHDDNSNFCLSYKGLVYQNIETLLLDNFADKMANGRSRESLYEYSTKCRINVSNNNIH